MMSEGGRRRVALVLLVVAVGLVVLACLTQWKEIGVYFYLTRLRARPLDYFSRSVEASASSPMGMAIRRFVKEERGRSFLLQVYLKETEQTRPDLVPRYVSFSTGNVAGVAFAFWVKDSELMGYTYLKGREPLHQNRAFLIRLSDHAQAARLHSLQSLLAEGDYSRYRLAEYPKRTFSIVSEGANPAPRFMTEELLVRFGGRACLIDRIVP